MTEDEAIAAVGEIDAALGRAIWAIGRHAPGNTRRETA